MQVVRGLRAGPNRELAIRIFRGHRSVLFDGQMRVALIEESVFEDFVSLREAVLNVAEFQGDTFVDVAVVAVIMDARGRGGESFFGIGNGCEEFVFNVDKVECFKRDQLLASDYRGDWIANMPDMVEAEGLLILADGQNPIF